MRTMRAAACLLLCWTVVGCGGGGGGGSGSETPPGAFTLSGTSATFTALQGGAQPASTSLAMTITGPRVAEVGASYTGGQTQPSWLGIDIIGAGSNYNVVLSITSTGIAPGQYTSTFSVGTADASGNILRSQQVTVNYTVTALLAISDDAYLSTFIYGDTRTSESVPVSVTAPDRSWTASSDSSWLQVPGTTQIGNGTVNATVDTSSLEPGQHQGRITVANTANAQDSATRLFTITVQAPTFTVAQTSILLGGVDGLSNVPQTLSFTLTSGEAAHPFVITPTTDSGGNWLNVNAMTGMVGAAGTSVQVSAVRGSFPGATYTGELQVSVTVRDLVFTELVPVTYNMEANRILVGAAGVGLSSSPAPARSILTRDVTVFSTVGRADVPWQASSNAPWVTVTASGTTGEALTLTANPIGLAADTTHFATVTVTSADATVENQETIRVGLHINSTAPADLSQTITSQFLAASPVEPIVFIHNGGGNITGYNVYTGSAARTFSAVVANAGAMVVGADGQHLYVYDRTNLRVTQLHAVTGALIRHYASALDGETPAGGGLALFRPSGYSILVTPSARMYDVNTGAEYFDSQFRAPVSAVSLAASTNSAYLVTHSGSVYRMRRTALSGGTITTEFLFDPGTAQGRAGQACISADDEYVYTASGAPYDFRGTSLSTRQLSRILPGTSYPNSILCLWNGVIVGGVDGYYSSYDVWIYDGPSGQELARRSSGVASSYRSLVGRGMAASADASRLITLTENEVRWQSIPGEI